MAPMPPKKVLIVSYLYPPMTAMGAVRAASFARHLPKLGWQPYVITVKPGSWVLSDAPIPEGEPPESVCRTACVDVNKVVPRLFGGLFRAGGVTRSRSRRKNGFSLLAFGMSIYDSLLAFPDSTWPWYFLGRRQALAFAARVKPDLILSTSYPFMSHVMAAEIQKALGVPWVAELRDLWSGNTQVQYSPFARWEREKFEARVLRRASALCTASEPFAEELRRTLGKDVFVVMNGFEPEDYKKDVQPLKDFTVLFTGMTYPGKLDPDLLFRAVRSLKDEGRLIPGLRLAFYGPNHDVTKDLAREAGIEELVDCPGMVPAAQALELQQRAHLLLVLDWNDAVSKGVFPGKLFEYLGAGRPILAIGQKEGVMDQALRKTGMGAVVSELGEVKEALLKAFAAHQTGAPLMPERRPDEVARFTRERQAKVLAEKLSSLVEAKG